MEGQSPIFETNRSYGQNPHMLSPSRDDAVHALTLLSAEKCENTSKLRLDLEFGDDSPVRAAGSKRIVNQLNFDGHGKRTKYSPTVNHDYNSNYSPHDENFPHFPQWNSVSDRNSNNGASHEIADIKFPLAMLRNENASDPIDPPRTKRRSVSSSNSSNQVSTTSLRSSSLANSATYNSSSLSSSAMSTNSHRSSTGGSSPNGKSSAASVKSLTVKPTKSAKPTRQSVPPVRVLEAPEPVQNASTARGEGYKRRDKSLGLLCDNFLRYCMHQPNGVVCLDHAAAYLNVERRRIYDVTNILEALDIVSRCTKNRYTWHGTAHIHHSIKTLADSALEDIGARGRILPATKLQPNSPVTPETLFFGTLGRLVSDQEAEHAESPLNPYSYLSGSSSRDVPFSFASTMLTTQSHLGPHTLRGSNEASSDVLSQIDVNSPALNNMLVHPDISGGSGSRAAMAAGLKYVDMVLTGRTFPDPLSNFYSVPPLWLEPIIPNSKKNGKKVNLPITTPSSVSTLLSIQSNTSAPAGTLVSNTSSARGGTISTAHPLEFTQLHPELEPEYASLQPFTSITDPSSLPETTIAIEAPCFGSSVLPRLPQPLEHLVPPQGSWTNDAVDIECTLEEDPIPGRLRALPLLSELIYAGSGALEATRRPRRDRSLGVLTQRFLKVFLLDRKVVTLDFAATYVINDEDAEEDEDEDEAAGAGAGRARKREGGSAPAQAQPALEDSGDSSKLKARRLYDIANVLCALRIIDRVHVRGRQAKKPAFRWRGPAYVYPVRGVPIPDWALVKRPVDQVYFDTFSVRDPSSYAVPSLEALPAEEGSWSAADYDESALTVLSEAPAPVVPGLRLAWRPFLLAERGIDSAASLLGLPEVPNAPKVALPIAGTDSSTSLVAAATSTALTSSSSNSTAGVSSMSARLSSLNRGADIDALVAAAGPRARVVAVSLRCEGLWPSSPVLAVVPGNSDFSTTTTTAAVAPRSRASVASTSSSSSLISNGSNSTTSTANGIRGRRKSAIAGLERSSMVSNAAFPMTSTSTNSSTHFLPPSTPSVSTVPANPSLTFNLTSYQSFRSVDSPFLFNSGGMAASGFGSSTGTGTGVGMGMPLSTATPVLHHHMSRLSGSSGNSPIGSDFSPMIHSLYASGATDFHSGNTMNTSSNGANSLSVRIGQPGSITSLLQPVNIGMGASTPTSMNSSTSTSHSTVKSHSSSQANQGSTAHPFGNHSGINTSTSGNNLGLCFHGNLVTSSTPLILSGLQVPLYLSSTPGPESPTTESPVQLAQNIPASSMSAIAATSPSSVAPQCPLSARTSLLNMSSLMGTAYPSRINTGNNSDDMCRLHAGKRRRRVEPSDKEIPRPVENFNDVGLDNVDTSGSSGKDNLAPLRVSDLVKDELLSDVNSGVVSGNGNPMDLESAFSISNISPISKNGAKLSPSSSGKTLPSPRISVLISPNGVHYHSTPGELTTNGYNPDVFKDSGINDTPISGVGFPSPLPNSTNNSKTRNPLSAVISMTDSISSNNTSRSSNTPSTNTSVGSNTPGDINTSHSSLVTVPLGANTSYYSTASSDYTNLNNTDKLPPWDKSRTVKKEEFTAFAPMRFE